MFAVLVTSQYIDYIYSICACMSMWIFVTDVQNLQEVLMTIIQGCSEFPDPQSQKACFGMTVYMCFLGVIAILRYEV